MATVSKWFDYNHYMTSKLAQVQKTDASMSMGKLVAAFEAAGFSGADGAEKHFLAYGQFEELAPNAFFNAVEYYRAKAADYFDKEPKTVTDLDVATVKLALDKAGMSAWSHYKMFGTAEGVNPSNEFNSDAYMQAKVDALNAIKDGKQYTVDTLKAEFQKMGLSALEHFMTYGGGTGEPAGLTADGKIPDAYLVPESQKVNGGGSSEGKTFVLTTEIDNIVGTAGNDTIIGDFTVAGQVSVADQINGGAGIDTLELYGAYGTLPSTITNVEKLSLSGYGDNKAINVSSLGGVTDLILRNQSTQGTGDTTVTIAAGQTVTLQSVLDSGNDANEVIIAAAASVTSNTLILDKAGDATAGGNDLEIEIAGSGVKTLNLKTVNNASRISLQDETTTGADTFAVETINITGDKNLTVDALAASSASKVNIVASSFTGNLDLNLSASEVFVVTGGKGNDRFNFGANLDASDKVNGGDGTDILATSTSTVNQAFANIIDSKSDGVANNASIEVLEYTGTSAYVLDASLIKMSSLKTYSTSGIIAPTQIASDGTTVGTTAIVVTGQDNSQTFSIEANVTGGTGQANTSGAGGAGGIGIDFAPAVDNGQNTLNLVLNGVSITGGKGGAGNANNNGGVGGHAADFSTFETVNITSTGAVASAVNAFIKGGVDTTAGSVTNTAESVVVSANTKLNISGENEINLGNIYSNNAPVVVNASDLSGKLVVGTGTGADTLTGGSGVNLLTLAGGADTVDLAKSVDKADVISVAAANTTISAFAQIKHFTNVATSGDKLDVTGTAAITGDASNVVAGANLLASISSGILTFTGSNAATATLADKVNGAVKAGLADAANDVVAFEHNGNTYIVSNQATDTTFNAGTDILIELTGVTGLSALSLTGSAANTLWVA